MIYMLLESSSWAEYECVKIFQQHFVVIKSHEGEKYALLSQGTRISEQIILKWENLEQENFPIISILKKIKVVTRAWGIH